MHRFGGGLPEFVAGKNFRINKLEELAKRQLKRALQPCLSGILKYIYFNCLKIYIKTIFLFYVHICVDELNISMWNGRFIHIHGLTHLSKYGFLIYFLKVYFIDN